MKTANTTARPVSAFVAVLTVASLPPAARACQECFEDSVEETLLLSELVVTGTITAIKPGFTVEKRGKRRSYVLGTVEVRGVLKGDKSLKTLDLVCPVGKTDCHSAGDEGLWMLEKDKDHSRYWSAFPKKYQVYIKEPRVRQIIAAQEQLQNGPVNNGLRLIFFLQRGATPAAGGKTLQYGSVTGTGLGSALLLVQNVSAGSLSVCNYPRDRPTTLRLTDGLGRETVVDSVYPGKRPAANSGTPKARHFLQLDPGDTKLLRSFAVRGLPEISSTCRFTAVFRTDRTGTEVDVEKAWTGEIVSNEILLQSPEPKSSPAMDVPPPRPQ